MKEIIINPQTIVHPMLGQTLSFEGYINPNKKNKKTKK